jgi:hypothetical protein
MENQMIYILTLWGPVVMAFLMGMLYILTHGEFIERMMMTYIPASLGLLELVVVGSRKEDLAADPLLEVLLTQGMLLSGVSASLIFLIFIGWLFGKMLKILRPVQKRMSRWWRLQVIGFVRGYTATR